PVPAQVGLADTDVARRQRAAEETVVDDDHRAGEIADGIAEPEFVAALQMKSAAADRIESADEQPLTEFVQHKSSFVRQARRWASAARRPARLSTTTPTLPGQCPRY